jgi:hypothetical protein
MTKDPEGAGLPPADQQLQTVGEVAGTGVASDFGGAF